MEAALRADLVGSYDLYPKRSRCRPDADAGNFYYMNRKYQVFVSSTYKDLVDERREVIQALLEMDCLPAGMEMFPAADEDQWTLIKEVIDECDYYVVIVGGRYGSMSVEGISYTEMEYDYAVSLNMPVLGFVHSDPDSIPVGSSELDASAREKLEAFRKKVMSRMVKQYSSPEELGSVVSRGLNRAFRRSPRPGWVRGDQAMTPEMQAEVANLRAQLAEAKQDTSEKAARDKSGSTKLNTEFEHGEDEFQLEYLLSAYHGFAEIDQIRTTKYSWDEVFRTLAPSMIGEASEAVLRGAWNSRMMLDADALVAPSDLEDISVSITDSSWNEIIVQLRALGAIMVGDRKRPIADKATYWKLTPAGDDYLVKLRARRRNSSDESA